MGAVFFHLACSPWLNGVMFSCLLFAVLGQSLLDSISVALRDNELQAKSEERRKKREAQEKKRYLPVSCGRTL